MRQTLFYFPHEVAGLPLFGAGWMLIAWSLFALVLLGVLWRRHGWSGETKGYLPVLLAMGAAILFVVPRLEVDGLGLPIRGYGAFMLAGVIAGVATAVYRGKRQGIDPDQMMSLAFWMFVAGIVGARAFFIIQYWDSFQRGTWFQTVGQMLKFTEGGLVVYGSLAGALLAFVIFCRRQQLSALAVGDIIGPSMLLGLALGRIGCLMNGCCYGGVCEGGPVCISFPRYSSVQKDKLSPPYQQQLVLGQLHGIRIAPDATGGPVIAAVAPSGPAAAAGVSAGARITRLNGREAPTFGDVQAMLAQGPPTLTIRTVAGEEFSWATAGFPERSLPVQPTQIYSSINAFLLFLTLWLFFPFRWKDGQVIFLTLGLYAISRFVLEMIRTDEGGYLGTLLTISQWVSVISIVAIVVLGVVIHRQPRLNVRAAA